MTTKPDTLSMRLPTAYLNKHLLMFGEIHGTREAPEAVSDALDQAQQMGKEVVLGVEYPLEIQPALDRLSLSGDSSELRETLFFRQGRDGRTSDAMVAMLEAAGRRGIPIRCFDLDTTQRSTLVGLDMLEGSAARDQIMGQNLLALTRAYPRNVLIVTLSGNLHSSSLPSEGYTKAGEVVREGGVDMASVRLEPRSGNRWGLAQSAEGWVSGPQSLAAFDSTAGPRLVETPGSGHDATYYQDEVHASPPARARGTSSTNRIPTALCQERAPVAHQVR